MSTQPPVPSSTPTPSSTNTTTSPLGDTSTLLFGFLVSALSMFSIFMTSAIVWNRLVARRRAIDAMLAMSLPPNLQRSYRPTIWNVSVTPNKQPPPWLSVKPVAAQTYECPPIPSRTTQTEQTISFWRHHLLDRLPPEITYLFRQPIPPSLPASSNTDISQVELSHGSDVQISLLITMPHAPQSTREYRQTLHEIVFATTELSYHDPAPS